MRIVALHLRRPNQKKDFLLCLEENKAIWPLLGVVIVRNDLSPNDAFTSGDFPPTFPKKVLVKVNQIKNTPTPLLFRFADVGPYPKTTFGTRFITLAAQEIALDSIDFSKNPLGQLNTDIE